MPFQISAVVSFHSLTILRASHSPEKVPFEGGRVKKMSLHRRNSIARHAQLQQEVKQLEREAEREIDAFNEDAIVPDPTWHCKKRSEPIETNGVKQTSSNTSLQPVAEEDCHNCEDQGATNQCNNPSAVMAGAEYEATIANLEGRGFERSHIDLALHAACYNPDRALKYLLKGTPKHIQRHRNLIASTSSCQTTNADRKAAIANFERKGFRRSHIALALRAACYDPDRALEYLLKGTPKHIQRHRNLILSTNSCQTTNSILVTASDGGFIHGSSKRLPIHVKEVEEVKEVEGVEVEEAENMGVQDTRFQQAISNSRVTTYGACGPIR